MTSITPTPTVTNAEVECVARAIAIADGKDPDAPAWVRFPSGQTEGICWRDQYSDKARAAISAMPRSDEELRSALRLLENARSLVGHNTYMQRQIDAFLARSTLTKGIDHAEG